MQKKRKTNYQIVETKQISSRSYTITKKKLQKQNANTKLQKLKGRKNTKFVKTEWKLQKLKGR
jgi:hypothetical protein